MAKQLELTLKEAAVAAGVNSASIKYRLDKGDLTPGAMQGRRYTVVDDDRFELYCSLTHPVGRRGRKGVAPKKAAVKKAATPKKPAEKKPAAAKRKK